MRDLTFCFLSILSPVLHMHQAGIRMTNEVIRNNEVVRMGFVDVFDFDEQGGFQVPQEQFTIMPGDTFRTSCYYRDGGVFGLSSQEEMCIAYLLYYPAISNFGFTWGCPYGLQTPICSQEYENTDLSSETELDRVFGSSGSVCPATPSTPTTPDPEPTPNPVAPTQAPLVASPPPTLSPTKLSLPTNIQETPTQVDADTTPPVAESPTNGKSDISKLLIPQNEQF